jgi:hypothetical protein
MKKIKIPLWVKMPFYFLEYFYGFFRSLIMVVFRPVKYPGVFFGLLSRRFAKVYGRKRELLWRSYWDQKGRRQGLVNFTPTKILVCSALELKAYQKEGYFP